MDEAKKNICEDFLLLAVPLDERFREEPWRKTIREARSKESRRHIAAGDVNHVSFDLDIPGHMRANLEIERTSIPYDIAVIELPDASKETPGKDSALVRIELSEEVRKPCAGNTPSPD